MYFYAFRCKYNARTMPKCQGMLKSRRRAATAAGRPGKAQNAVFPGALPVMKRRHVSLIFVVFQLTKIQRAVKQAE